jgi:hypothetical protein
MAENHRTWRTWVLAKPHVDVRAAHATGEDSDEHLAGAEPGQGELALNERLAKGLENHGNGGWGMVHGLWLMG